MALFGRQLVVLFEHCSEKLLRDNGSFIDSVSSVVHNSGLHVVKFIEYRFEPQGLTLVWILSESHLLIHTWPEYSAFLVDLFVCQDEFNVESFVEGLCTVSGAVQTKIECSFEK